MDEITSIQAALLLGRNQLEAHSETASLDVRVLLAHLLQRSQAWVLSHPEQALSEEIQQEFKDYLQRLIEGEPLPYLLGHWEFYGRSFRVTPEVLIPRPETEGLIERGLAHLARLGHPGVMIDAGTGSGCIAITMATELADLQVIATDRSRGALRIAKDNADLHAVNNRISWIQCDLLLGVHRRVDLILANLPYIPSERLSQLAVTAYEPLLALDGGALGLDLIERLIDRLPYHLVDGGMAILEIDHSHAQAVRDRMMKLFPSAEVAVLPDLYQQTRYIALTQPIDL